MEHVNLINRIIEAENKAQQIAGEAKEKRMHLQEDLQDAKDTVHKTYMSRAEKRIDMIRQREVSLADEAIAGLDARFEKDMADIERSFAENSETWEKKLFEMIVRK